MFSSQSTVSKSTHKRTLPNKRATTPSAMSHSHSHQQQSTGAGRPNNSNTAENARRTWPSAPAPQDDLINHINSHLAWQESEPLPWDTRAFVHEFHAYQAHAASRELRRRSSAGTLIVDWDGTGSGRAYFRGREACAARESSSMDGKREEGPGIDEPGAESFTALYSPTRNAVCGRDAATRYTYDYNGHVVHVRRSALPADLDFTDERRHSHTHVSLARSEVDEFFALPVESYVPGVPLRVSQNAGREKSLPPLPGKGKVVGFVEKVMRKLDRSGVLGKMRKRRARERKSGGRD